MRQRVTCGQGSICAMGVCTCPPATKLQNGVCEDHRTGPQHFHPRITFSAYPGESCANGEECQRNSYCSDVLRCVCRNSDQIEIGRTCQNRLRSHPGFPCDNGEMCVGGSYCDMGKCVCAAGQQTLNKQCVERVQGKDKKFTVRPLTPRLVPPGGDCSQGQMCLGNSECDAGSKRCKCQSGQVPIANVSRNL